MPGRARTNRSGYLTFTLGGLSTPLDGEVFNIDGATIAGLYAAGRVASGLATNDYIGGISLGDGTFFGSARPSGFRTVPLIDEPIRSGNHERRSMTILDMYRLNGKIAVVTGASTGLGVAVATALAEAGADLVLAARRADLLEQTRTLVEKHGHRALTVPTDVADPEQCHALVKAAVAEFGGVDLLVNNAGLAAAVPALRESPEEFQRVMDVNLNGTYWMAKECAAVMRPGSAIVNVGSVLALKTAGLPQAAYSASKAAVLGLTRDLAQQWTGRRGIRVNALVPGYFPTDMVSASPAGYVDSMRERIPAGRLGDPRELAASAVFLLSDAAGYVTGTTLVVDGGFSIA